MHPDVLLVHGYNQATNLLGWIVAKALRIRVLMRGDTRPTPHHDEMVFKTQLKRAMFRLVDGCVSIGTLNQTILSGSWCG